MKKQKIFKILIICFFLTIVNSLYLFSYRDIIIPEKLIKLRTLTQLKPYLFDSGEETRAGTVARLAEIGDKDSIEILKDIYEKETYTWRTPEGLYGVKERVLLALGKIGGDKAKEVLLDTIKKEIKTGPRDWAKDNRIEVDFRFIGICNCALRSLILWKDKEVKNFLLEIFNSETTAVIEMGEYSRGLASLGYFRIEMQEKGILTVEEKVNYLISNLSDSLKMIQSGVQSAEAVKDDGIRMAVIELGPAAIPFLEEWSKKFPENSYKKNMVDGMKERIEYFESIKSTFTPSWLAEW